MGVAQITSAMASGSSKPASNIFATTVEGKIGGSKPGVPSERLRTRLTLESTSHTNG
jgi:hypothetical protein